LCKAKWIAGTEVFDPKQEDCNISDPWLRKCFKLSFSPEKANIYVDSIGYHVLYVNGKHIGDEVLAPVVTDHTKRVQYVIYDIAQFFKKGDNVIHYG